MIKSLRIVASLMLPKAPLFDHSNKFSLRDIPFYFNPIRRFIFLTFLNTFKILFKLELSNLIFEITKIFEFLNYFHLKTTHFADI